MLSCLTAPGWWCSPGARVPHEAMKGEWPAAGWKKIYKRVRPVGWLEAHWR